MTVFNQAESTQKVHDKVLQMFKNRFPYEINGYTIDVSDIKFEMPDVGLKAQEDAFADNATVEEIVRGTLTLTKGEEHKEMKNIVFARIPAVTDRGTYILNGNENIFLNQMKLRPGIFVHQTEKDKETGEKLKSEVRYGKRRAVMTFDTTKASLKIDGLKMGYWSDPKTVDVLSLLTTLGATDAEIKDAIQNDGIFKSLKEHQKIQSPKALLSALGGEVVETDDDAKEEISKFLERDVTFDKRAKQVSEQMIGKGFDSFNKDAILATIKQMFTEYKRPNSTPSVDDIRFKQVDSGEDIIAIGIEKGIDGWVNKLKKSLKNNTGKPEDVISFVRPKDELYKGVKEMYNSNLCQFVDSPNPLDLQQKKQQLTLLGLEGLTKRTAKDQNRELQDTGFAKIDPVETPQSLSMGLIQHLARDADIKDGKIYSKFYRVNNGVVDTSKTVDDMDPLDEFDEYIAFNNPEYVEKKDGQTSITKNEVRVRHKGEFITVSKDKVTLMDKSPTSHLGFATNLIPFGAHNDGARMLMGGSMQRQALPLEDPDVPLVQSISGDKTIEEEVAENSSHLLRSPVAGEITQIGDDFIKIKEEDGNETKVNKLNYFSTGKAGGYINHKPVVKVGDKVGVNDLLADGWQSKKGNLALGKNTLVGYMSYEGYNFEDGVVVSQSFADKMVSEEVKLLEFETDENVITGKEALEKLKALGVSEGILSKLDDNGLIKRTESVTAGDILVAAVKEKPKSTNDAEGLVAKFLEVSMVSTTSTQYSDRSKRATGYQKGKIIDVKVLPQGDGKTKYVIKMLSFKPMREGDKLSGRHGNKGTITKILPDAEMPRTEDGKPLELLFSPLAVPSRKNLGQLLEVNAGAVAMKKGMSSYKVNNFDKKEKDRLFKEMEDLGMKDGKQYLINPNTGKRFENPVTVGPMYIMKLKHKVEGKITSRNTWQDDKMTHQPKKVSGSIDGDRRNPQSIGAMELWSLTSAGAVHNIHEMNTLKSDGAGDYKGRMQIYNAIRNGEKIKDPVTPETLKVFSDKLYGIGIRMVPLKDGEPTSLENQFNSLMLKPIGSGAKEADGMASVTSPKTMSAKKKKFEAGGLYDEAVFGEEGEKWGKIELSQPVPNPLYMTDGQGPPVYAAMLASKGISNRDIRRIINDGYFVVTNPGDSGLEKNKIIDHKEYEKLVYTDKKNLVCETGATALNTLLDSVDLKKEFSLAEERLKNAKRLDDRSKAQRDYEILAAALDNNMKPKDYLLDFVPVLPVKYREPVKSQDGMSITDDGITKLYQRFMNAKTQGDKAMKNLQESGADMSFLPPEYQSAMDRNTATSLTQIFGTTSKEYKDPVTGQEFKGILHTLKSKHGFVRGKMQSKTQDYSGRSVIIVDPQLAMDEVTLPEDMAAEMFKPQLIGKLMNDGLTSAQAKTAIKTRNDNYQHAMKRIIAEKPPVILNRQPSLHRHSLQAFIPKIRWNEDGETSRAIGLNPMVTSGFNADFDGDTMAVYLPITEKAKQEAKEKLLPSQNLLNPTNNRLIMELKHEMQLGIYYMTRDQMPKGAPKQFKSYAELKRAYEKGQVETYDAVQMNVQGQGLVTATAGKHLFNGLLPAGYRNFKTNENLNDKKLTKLLSKMIQDPKVGPMKTSQVMNELQKLSFKASTISSISIGVRDFDPVANIDKGKLFSDAEKSEEVKEKTETAVANFIDRREAFEQAKTDFVQDEIKKQVTTLFDNNNPVEIMRNSGARGNAGQITAMGGIVGVGKKVGGKRTRSVNSSLLEGLSPDEFWDLADDSRKGIYDRSVATAEPGALSRRVWMSNKQTIVVEKDCGTKRGVTLSMEQDSDRRNLRGRILLKPVQIKTQDGLQTIQPSAKPITEKLAAKIEAFAVNKKIEVRSPMTCESTKGVCQMCYGSKPGAMQFELVPIGEPVGSIAGQAIGEPSTQAIMKTFHVGSSGSNLGNAFKQIEQVLKVPKTMANQAVVVEKDGIVKDMTNDPLKGWVITVDRRKYQLNNKPKNPQIKVGMPVQAGESLTEEWNAQGQQITFRNPRDVIKYQGVDAAKEYMLASINSAFENGGIEGTDRRHYEVAVSNMFNTGTVRGGGTSKMNPGQHVPMKAVEDYNKPSKGIMGGKQEIVTADLSYGNKINVVGAKSANDYHEKGSFTKVIVKKGEPITDATWEQLRKDRKFIKVYKQRVNAEQGIQGVEAQRYKTDNNWFDSVGSSHASQILADASGRMLVDKLDNPLSRQMAGLKGNFGTEFETFKNTIQNKFSDFV